MNEYKLWIARDKNDNLYLYYDEPIRTEDFFLAMESYEGKPFMYARHLPKTKIPNDMFPEITMENSPVEVELKLKERNG